MGEAFYIKTLKTDDVKSFAGGKGVNVVIFADHVASCSFANFAISRYSDFEFAIAPESSASGFNCSSFPCALAFKNGKYIEDCVPAPTRPTSFALWCERVKNPGTVVLKNEQFLRIVLETPGVAVFGVGVSKRPRKLSKDAVFYVTTQKIFSDLGISVDKGVYVYRNADRQLLPVEKDNFAALSATKMMNLAWASNRKYVGGFVTREDEDIAVEIELMSKLADEFERDFHVGIIPRERVIASRLSFLSGPTFVVFPNDPSSTLEHRYVLRRNCHNIEALREFMEAISAGKIDFSVINEDYPPEGYMSLEMVRDIDNGTDVVLVISDTKRAAIQPAMLCDKIKFLANSSLLQVFTFNAAINDLPEGVRIDKVPSVVMINAKGKHTFTGRHFSFSGLLDFVLTKASNTYTVPEVNDKIIDDEVKRYMKIAERDE